MYKQNSIFDQCLLAVVGALQQMQQPMQQLQQQGPQVQQSHVQDMNFRHQSEDIRRVTGCRSSITVLPCSNCFPRAR